MSRFIAFVFAACSLPMWISTSVSAANPDWPKSLILATASPGGVYQIYGDELAQILKENLGISVNALATQGPVHNVKLLENGDAQLGMITMGVGLHGWNGIGDWTNGKQFRNMRVLFPMYDTPFQAVALRRSGIAMFAQLEKKIIGIGPRAGTGGTYIPTILKLLGISAEVRYASFDVVAEKLLTGQYDAIVTLTGVPVPAVEQVAAKGPVTLLGLSPEQIEAIRKGLPEFTGSNIADRTYEFQLKDYGTIGMYNFAVGRPDLPDDLVYHLVKAALQNQQRLVKAHPAARETVSENILKDSFMPLHRGAVRYYQEIGIHIPDILN